MSEQLVQQLEGLSHLVLAQSKALQAEDLAQLAFSLVNDSRLLVNYEVAVYYHLELGKELSAGKLLAASDVPELDKRSEFAESAKRAVLACAASHSTQIQNFALGELTDAPDKGTLPEQLLWIPIHCLLKSAEQSKAATGGVLLMRHSPWKEQESRVLAHWQQAACHALIKLSSQSRLRRLFLLNRKRRWLSLGATTALLLLMLLPVKLSVVAPAEVIPLAPKIVRSPLSSVIETVHIEPYQRVNPGDLLLSLDDKELKTRFQVANQGLTIAEAELKQAQQAALYNAKAKASLPILQMTVEQQQAEYDYLSDLLTRSQIRASQAGVAILDDTDSLLGRPVKLGEKLLTLAELEQIELQVWLPVGDDIPLAAGDEVLFYPDTAPDLSIRAQVDTVAYQATATPETGLAYRLVASVSPEQKLSVVRIGMRGPAKVSGQQVTLFYYLFRKPMATVRRWFGV